MPMGDQGMNQCAGQFFGLRGKVSLWLEPLDRDSSVIMLASPNGSNLPAEDFFTNLSLGGVKYAVSFSFSGGIKGQKLYRASAISLACDECPPSPTHRLLFSEPHLEEI